MSSQTGGSTPINQQADLVSAEYVGIAPPVAGVQRSAAAADHTHRIFASSSEITGFGRMLTVKEIKDAYGYAPASYLFSKEALPVPAEWTAEFWVSAPSGAGYTGGTVGPQIAIGWAAADGNYPVPNPLGNGGSGNGFMGMAFQSSNSSAGAIWDGGYQVAPTEVPEYPVVGAAPLHCFVQMDSDHNMWIGAGGSLRGPFAQPAGSGILDSAFAFIALYTANIGGGDTTTLAIDEVRFSSALRYPTSGTTYAVPTAPFDPDSSAIILWHLDDVPYGQFLDSNGDGTNVFVPANFETQDATLNAIDGVFAAVDFTGQSTGNPLYQEFGGSNSNVGPNSGSGTARTVESIQGQTGNFLFLDKTGAVIPVSNPTGAQEIQVAPTPALAALPTANPPVSGTVYQNTGATTLKISLGIAATAAGTAQWALGPGSAPAAWGPATTTVVGAVIDKYLEIPPGWYWSITVTGTATIGTASVIST